jgi:hypothetical protein
MDTIGVAVLLWLAAGIRIWRSAQKPHAAGLRALAIALVAIAIAATVNIPVVATWVDTTSRWPNIGDLVKQITIVIAACGNQVMLLHLQADSSGDTAGTYHDEPARRIRGHWAAAAAVSALSMMLFLIGGRYREVGTEFARIYAGTPWLSDSRVVVTVYAAVILCFVVRLCLKQVERSALGRGILLLAVGSAVVVIYCVARIVFLLGHRIGIAVPNSVFDFGTICIDIGLPLVALGTLVPAFEMWRRARRDLRGLSPLWEHLVPIMPVVGGGDPPRDAELSLVADHRVVKIQDGLYVLGQRSGLPDGTVIENRLPRADAAALSAWLRGDPTSNATLAMLQTPSHLTDREWSVLIARTFADPPVTGAPVR